MLPEVVVLRAAGHQAQPGACIAFLGKVAEQLVEDPEQFAVAWGEGEYLRRGRGLDVLALAQTVLLQPASIVMDAL